MFRVGFFMLVSALMTTTAVSKTFKADKGRTIYVRGSINGQIMNQARTLENLSAKTQKPITIIINSPGGDVLAGSQFVSAMRVAKARGVVLRCLVPVMAASMAMTIFNECSHRFALPQSMFLWHSVRVTTRKDLTPRELRRLLTQIRLLQMGFNKRLIENLDISKRIFYEYFYGQYLVPGQALKQLSPGYVTLVNDFVGVEDPFSL